jgi:hypothetical protein
MTFDSVDAAPAAAARVSYALNSLYTKMSEEHRRLTSKPKGLLPITFITKMDSAFHFR